MPKTASKEQKPETGVMAETALPLVLRRKQMLKLLGLSATTVYKMQRDGRFPRPIQLSTRTTGWLAADVKQWLKERSAAAKAA